MYLISGQYTVPTENRDYPEWHKYRQNYGLWYLEIKQPEVLAYLEQLRESFKDLLYTPNQRQFHITLFICGFLNQKNLYDDDFSEHMLHKQLQSLQSVQLPRFRLCTQQVNSFQSALFVEVEDSTGHLKKIRQILAQHSNEIASLTYCPHITIGLYKHSILADQVWQRIDALPSIEFELDIHHLSFGYYHATQLQGKLYMQQQLILETQ